MISDELGFQISSDFRQVGISDKLGFLTSSDFRHLAKQKLNTFLNWFCYLMLVKMRAKLELVLLLDTGKKWQ